MTICAIDTETTGLDMVSHIVELCIVPTKVEKGELVQDTSKVPFNILVNPGELELHQGKDALAFNKIGSEVIIKEGVPSKQVLPMLKGWMMANGIKKIVPLAHNWVFDSKMLEILFSRKEMDNVFNHRGLDTMFIATFYNFVNNMMFKKDVFKSCGLTKLCEHWQIDTEGAHRALNDCLMTIKVFNQFQLTLKSLYEEIK